MSYAIFSPAGYVMAQLAPSHQPGADEDPVALRERYLVDVGGGVYASWVFDAEETAEITGTLKRMQAVYFVVSLN